MSAPLRPESPAALVARLTRELAAAQAKSTRAMEARAALHPGTTGRKRLATAHARWSIAAEACDAAAQRLDAARELLAATGAV